MQAPRERATFLFTDIERSSQLWEMHPQSMGRALARHDDLMREVFSGYDSHVFKTVGDAFCVAFGDTLSAVRAAVDAQRRLALVDWEETGPLRVRMAIHTGDAERRDNDYFGPTLNRVARILSTGHGGQTLLSEGAAEEVETKLKEGISLLDMGQRRLKDLSRPERIFQVVAEGLPEEFPPLRSIEVLPHNLPAQVTSFVGRAREMSEVKKALGEARLLTLTGPGGTGKTRLSLQVAADIVDAYTHGVWLVELATVADPDRIPEAIADAVDIREEAGRALLDTLLDALRHRRLLLVLDNCEHLVAGCARIADTLLKRCPEVRILASSREALGIPGETLWPVPPLTVPAFDPLREQGWTRPEGLEEMEAIQLFVERVVAVQPGFTLTRENAPLVGRLCWRLDGIPLAIELAAARVKMLSLEQILEKLDDRFRLLSRGSRAALPRQQTLGALIDWSHDLLSEPERILLRRLAVFVVGRTLEMVEEVCSGDGVEQEDVLDLLESLVDKSLLMIETGADGESRFTMLESIWDYASGKLEEHGEAAIYQRRHLDYFVRFAEEASPHLRGPDQKRWLEKVAVEHYNLNAALGTAAEGDAEAAGQGLRLAAAVSRYWEVRSYLLEGYEHLTRLLALAKDGPCSKVLAAAEEGAGRLSWCQDRDEDAMRHYRRALACFEKEGDRLQMGFVEAFMGFTERNEGNNEASLGHFRKAKAIAQELNHAWLAAVVENGFASLAADAGDFEDSRRRKEKALEVIKGLGDLWVVSLGTGSLGETCFTAGDYPAARTYLREALSISRDLGNKWSVPYAFEGLADICMEEGEAPKAVRLYGAAEAQREALALSFSPTERTSYDKALRRLHELVPAEAFATEWGRGKEMGLAAAVALAMQDGGKA